MPGLRDPQALKCLKHSKYGNICNAMIPRVAKSAAFQCLRRALAVWSPRVDGLVQLSCLLCQCLEDNGCSPVMLPTIWLHCAPLLSSAGLQCWRTSDQALHSAHSRWCQGWCQCCQRGCPCESAPRGCWDRRRSGIRRLLPLCGDEHGGTCKKAPSHMALRRQAQVRQHHCCQSRMGSGSKSGGGWEKLVISHWLVS